MSVPSRSVWAGYSIAVLATAGVVLLRTLLESWLHEHAPLFVLMATTVVAAWYGGLKPGLVATVLSAAVGAYYFAVPAESLSIDGTNEYMWLAMFMTVGAMISLVCEALHAARRRAEISTAEADKGRRRLKEADRRKSEFLAVLAHELRSPLAAISNALVLMEMPNAREADFRECVEIIRRQSDQMNRLVADLSDISRISRKKLDLRQEPLDLSEVVMRSIEASRPLIESHKHTLEVEVNRERLWIMGDSNRLTQVFTNLLNNAAKYTPDEGCLGLLITADGNDAVVHVRDTGIGIPENMLPRIFSMYTQVNGTFDRSHGGLGIGLSLVRGLVQMHGGTVEAFSEGPEKGSEFVVTLPLYADGPEGAASPSQPQDDYDVAPQVNSNNSAP